MAVLGTPPLPYRGPIRRFYFRLLQQGLNDREATATTAWAIGLPPFPDVDSAGWTLPQISALGFLRWLYAHRERLR